VKALIVEDEPLAIDALRKLLKNQAGFITIIGVARDGKEGLSMIEELKPDLIFLDVNIPVVNGLEMLNRLSYQPHVVFTTAYDEHAIKAFELNSIDYLLKPISSERFSKTLQRLSNLSDKKTIDSGPAQKALLDLFALKEFTTISVRIGDRFLFVPLEDITHFFADDKYVSLNTIESKQHITSFTIQELQEKLPSNFIRISRSVLINRYQLAEAHKLFGKKYSITLKDKNHSVVTTGAMYVESFLKILT
jgi:two-component system, LytTR family, response regulator